MADSQNTTFETAASTANLLPAELTIFDHYGVETDVRLNSLPAILHASKAFSTDRISLCYANPVDYRNSLSDSSRLPRFLAKNGNRSTRLAKVVERCKMLEILGK